MSNLKIKIIIGVVVSIIIFFAGFILGKKCTKEKVITNTVYVESQAVQDSLVNVNPIEIVKPTDTSSLIVYCVKHGLYYDLFPEKVRDSIVIISDVDSLKNRIVEDWKLEKKYHNILFQSDSLGLLNLDMKIQYNRITSIKYDYHPRIKTVVQTTTYERKITPFVGVGLTTMPSFIGQAGLIFKDGLGFSAMFQYNTATGDSFYGGNLIYSF